MVEVSLNEHDDEHGADAISYKEVDLGPEMSLEDELNPSNGCIATAFVSAFIGAAFWLGLVKLFQVIMLSDPARPAQGPRSACPGFRSHLNKPNGGCNA